MTKKIELTAEQLARAKELLEESQKAEKSKQAACLAEIDAVLQKYGYGISINANPTLTLVALPEAK